jgi:hypothetical protein
MISISMLGAMIRTLKSRTFVLSALYHRTLEDAREAVTGDRPNSRAVVKPLPCSPGYPGFNGYSRIPHSTASVDVLRAVCWCAIIPGGLDIAGV